MASFPSYKQPDQRDCGPTCLKIIAEYYRKTIPLAKIRSLSETSRQGSSLLYLSNAAEKIGFKTIGVRISYQDLTKNVPLPCVLHWEDNHYIVVYKVRKDKVCLSDPARGLIVIRKPDFLRGWIGENADNQEGIALLLEPRSAFYQNEWDTERKYGFSSLYQYLYRYKNLLLQLILGLIGGSLLQLALPFLTQSIVDVGIQNQDIGFIYLILLAQLMLFLGSISIELIRGWVLLHLSTRLNISLVSDFFIKLMRLPISFFDTRITGDIMQRINDHRRIEQLLTNTSLSTLFSFANILVFSFVLAYYSLSILTVFLVGSIIYVLWILLFLKRRKQIDYLRFSQVATEQSKVIELINGMQEIKLHNAEKQKRWGWEFIQIRLYKIAMKSLALEQTQGAGSKFIDQIKNIVITVVAATLVVKGEITLGMMLAIQYIIGQLNAPISQIVGFVQSLQDAQISLERLGEIHNKDDEEPLSEQKIANLRTDCDIVVNSLNFRYRGVEEAVLKDINLTIPARKITAIVGMSGSGKTTLMKLLMNFYQPQQGEIKLGNINLRNISQTSWRDHSGVVMQEGYIFNDTIAANIAVGDDYINRAKIQQAVSMANIQSFIESLPNSYNTNIGNEGIGISTGQKQRLLIARAVYKDPDILFFDEATSALDANNERIIMNNLSSFFQRKTVIIIAHRLSTVRNADQIVMLDNGKITEIGNHETLVNERNGYFKLVKNQLEL
jgi:ATP-binding cassette subfamily B protein